MAQETTAKKKVKEENMQKKIADAYRREVLLHGQDPQSVFAFCEKLEISEDEFYRHYNGFEQIAEAFWAELFEETLQALEQTGEFSEFGVRDKFLSFYFSYFENLKRNRSYALLRLDGLNLQTLLERQKMKELKDRYKDWAQQMIIEAKNRDEIAGRSRVSNTYDDLLWYQFLFLLDYWKRDRSRGFEGTDEAIEKAVNLAFDLIEKNAIDSAFEFGKFLFQNR